MTPPSPSSARALPAYGLAVLGGCLYFLGFAGFDIWPLAFIAHVPLFLALDIERESGTRRILGLGLAYGFTCHVGGFYWLVTFLQDFGGFGIVPALLISSLFWVAHGLQYSAYAWLYRRARASGFGLLPSGVASFAVVEFAFPALFPNFFATSFHNVPILIQVADLGGPLLVGALAVAVNAGIYHLLFLSLLKHQPGWFPASVHAEPRPPAWLVPTIAATLLAIQLGYGAYRIAVVEERIAASPTWDIAAVQTNMGIHEKREDPYEGHRRHVEQSVALERDHDLDLIVWPESAVTWFLPQRDNLLMITAAEQRNGDRIGPLHTPVLFGGLQIRGEGENERHFNTAFLIDASGDVQGTYDKTYLLAFGEYLPFGETFPSLYDLSPNSGHFTPGDHVRSLDIAEYRITTLICYEDILPAFVNRAVYESNPHLLVNITNDAWFGDTNEPWIHLALAKFRAVEHRRYLIRATNSGVSAVIDPVGRVTSLIPSFERGELRDRVALMTNHTAYETLGDWVGWLALVATVVIVGSGVWRRRQRSARNSKSAPT